MKDWMYKERNRRKTSGVRAIFVAVLAWVLMMSAAVPNPAYAEEQSPSDGLPLNAETAEAFLEQFFAAEPAQDLFVGASVVIVKDGQVIAQKGYGHSDLDSGAGVDPASTVFRIASVSKTFTAVAVMQLVEQGKIALDADIRTYLPGIAVDNPFDRPVTVADLLTHRSGFEVRDLQPDDVHTDFDVYVSIEDYVKEHMPPVVREPGTAYMYDNFAFLLLGLIVQNVSGEPFEQYMENRVFKPLGMENSGFAWEDRLVERLATGYDSLNQPLDHYLLKPNIQPTGGMLSTAADVGRFMLAFLNGGEFAGESILSEATIKEMSVFRSAIHPLLPDTAYGFEAAFQFPLAGSNDAVLAKYGDLNGYSSMLFMIPEQQTGVFMTYNKTSELRMLFYQQFMAAFFPEYVKPSEPEEFKPLSAEMLEQLTGLYVDLRLPSIVTVVEADPDGNLQLSDALSGSRTLRQKGDFLFSDSLTHRYTAFLADDESGEVYMKDPFLNPFGYARKGDRPAGFADVAEADSHARYILALQSIGHYPNDPAAEFRPERPVTRGELVQHLLEISGLTGSDSQEYAFDDIADHPLAPYIQRAYELGLVSGDGSGGFAPDRAATRQEAAVIIWNSYRQLFPDAMFAATALAGETDEWAIPAVKMVTALGLHGPEVAVTEDGAVDFRSKDPLIRREEAALLYQLLVQPIFSIAEQLAGQQ